jgi:hypothetical protein
MKHARSGWPSSARPPSPRPRGPPLAADEKQVAKLLKQLKDRKEDKRIEASYELVEHEGGGGGARAHRGPARHLARGRATTPRARSGTWRGGAPAIPELSEAAERRRPGRAPAGGGRASTTSTPRRGDGWRPCAPTLRDGGRGDAQARARPRSSAPGNGGIQSAAHDGQVEVVTGLLDGGIEVDAVDKHQRTALHWAAQADKPEVAKLLLAKGASTTLADEDKNQPLHLAALGRLRRSHASPPGQEGGP